MPHSWLSWLAILPKYPSKKALFSAPVCRFSLVTRLATGPLVIEARLPTRDVRVDIGSIPGGKISLLEVMSWLVDNGDTTPEPGGTAYALGVVSVPPPKSDSNACF